MARFTLLIFLILGSIVTAFGQASSSLQGLVTDEKGEPVMFANVALYKEGVLITGTTADFEGKYSFNSIDAGTYDVTASYVGYNTQKIAGVVVYAGKALTVNIQLTQGVTIEEVVVTYKVPLVEQDNTSQGAVVTSKDIAKLASKNINGIIAQSAGVSSTDDGGDISIRGSRTNATDYYIDGIRVSGSMIPQSDIEQLQVITGGLPASIGDITGGVISITTKGPSSEFSGNAEVETSQFLDGYGYNLGMLSLSGPLLKNKKGDSVIGYRLSGQYLSRKDRNPSAVGVYKLRDEVYQELTENPLVEILQGDELVAVPAAQFLTEDDVELVKTRPNSADTRYDATGKLDFRLSSSMDMAIGGSFNYRLTQPNGRLDLNDLRWQTYNYNRNTTDLDIDSRGFFRFRHRIGGGGNAEGDKEKAEKGTTIQNASYTLQFSYDRTYGRQQDPIHQNNLFNYGYIGFWDFEEFPTEGQEVDADGNPTGALVHTSYSRVATSYVPSEINAVLANYNKFVAAKNEFSTVQEFPFHNGFRNETLTSVYGVHTNVNDIYNRYRTEEENRYQFNAKGLFEIVPKGNKQAKHTIEFGLMYEQRQDRIYSIAPRGLWTVARQLTNKHFNGVDTTQVIGQFVGNITGILQNQYAHLAQEDAQEYFDYNLRNSIGAANNQWIFIDELTPDQLKLDYFAADELLDASLVSYYGYDHVGNPVGGEVSFNDYFTAKNADGIYTRPVAPNQPIYFAGYIEDKFIFKDIIFRIGLRVDRYDPNTKTLKDPYSLYEAYTASEFAAATATTVPNTIGEDFTVYTSDGTLEGTVLGYRSGNNWYNAEGSAVNSSISLSSGLIQPVLVDGDANIQAADFDPNSTFVDAEPTVNWMPRLAFSFPISDKANFFAHYDVLTQRPPSNALATAQFYYYFERNVQRGDLANNPSLRPERTIDYEVGFQQVLSENSAIKLSAYYKELRDMIQRQNYLNAFPLTYEGYGNQDFGTVKGFNFSYDLRRTGNISLKAAYTLQFAEGTGSDANSQRNVSNVGNLRTIYPLSFDERHRFNFTLDYRYDAGNKYNGPTIAGKQIFANAGLNLNVITASGRPYTARAIPQEFGGVGVRGSVNGARLPWNTTLNLRVDKDFILVKKAEGKKELILNVYFRVQNLLDAKNVLGVYSYSGSAEDDGYLASRLGQNAVRQFLDPAAYMLSYQWALLNPGFYAMPRRMYVGAVMNF